MSKITTFLTDNDQAEEAANLYVSLFESSRILSVSRYGEAGPAGAEGERHDGGVRARRPEVHRAQRRAGPWRRCSR